MKTKAENKKRFPGTAAHRILCAILCLGVLLSGVLFVLLSGTNRARALEMPDDYAVSFDTTLAKLSSPGDQYRGITYESDRTFVVTGSEGFVTLARVSQTTDFSGYTFKIAERGTVELSVNFENGKAVSEGSFFGIGNGTFPFRGTLYLEDATYDTYLEMTGWKVLFNNLSNEASVVSGATGRKLWSSQNGTFALAETLTVTNPGGALDISGFRFAAAGVETDRAAGLVAALVTGGECSVDLSPVFDASSEYTLTTAAGDAGGLFGVIDAGASVTATLGSFRATVTGEGGNAGLLVGVNRGSFTLVPSETGVTLSGGAVSGTDGASAGVIGVNEANASVTFDGALLLNSLTLTADAVGGVAGSHGVGATLTFAGDVTVSSLTASGIYAGGLVGVSDGSVTLADTVTCTVKDSAFSAKNETSVLGGAIAKTTAAPVGAGSFVLSGNSFGKTGTMGGFIGDFTADTDTVFSNVTVSSSVFDTANVTAAHSVGGYFGTVTANASFTLASDEASAFTFGSVRTGAIGGVIGTANATDLTNGVFVGKKTRTGTLTVRSTFESTGFSGSLGGVVGVVKENVYLRIDAVCAENTMNARGEGIADLVGTGEKNAFIDLGTVAYRNNGGSVAVSRTREGTILRLFGALSDTSPQFNHIVLVQDRSLLYADTGFSFASTGTVAGNDIGNYGQILRNDTLGFLSFDGTAHTVTPDKLSGGNSLTLSSAADVAKIYVTLSTEGIISCVDGIGAGNYEDLLSATLTLANDISLHASGVEQFTCSEKETAFRGKLIGAGHTLTLAVGENIGGENVGIMPQDNQRCYLGAFSAVSGATVDSLKLNGTLVYSGKVSGQVTAPVYIGGLAGLATGSVTVKESTTAMDITLRDEYTGQYSKSLHVGGFFGKVGKNAGVTLSVTNSVIAPVITHESGYSGGNHNAYIGGAAGSVISSGDVIFTGNTVKTGITQTHNVTNAYVGGVFAELTCNTYSDLDLRGTVADGAEIVVNASASAGGLLGREYTRCRILMNSLWEGRVINNGGAVVAGGLLYSLSGKLTAENGFSLGTSTFRANGSTRGALLGNGTRAFVVIDCDPSGFEGITADGYDLFVGRNIYAGDATYPGIGATGGLLTVETNGEEIGKIPAASDWFALMNAHRNAKTRYYFNVAGLEGYNATPVVSSPADLIYWNICDFIGDVTNALPDYVKASSFPNTVYSVTGATRDVNMTDYSFYPTKKSSVIFDFSGHKLTFGVTHVTPAENNQFYGLGSGIFSDLAIRNANETSVVFRNVRLSGTVCAVKGGSGAFVCGRIYGTRTTTVTAVAEVTVKNVVFEELTVETGNSYRPLFINVIDSNASCNLEGLTQEYAVAGTDAASSLIGKGGIKKGDSASEYIYVTFSNIVLNGKQGESVFSSAILFSAINYVSGAGSFTYNFNLAEDWDGNNHIGQVTYGKELYTNEKQQQYFDKNIYVSPVSPSASAPYPEFGTLYLVYVLTNPDDLSVNRKGVNFDEGFGTYEHPYIIRTAEQLLYLSQIIGGNISSFGENWTINFPKKPSSSSTAYNYTDYDAYVADGNGELVFGAVTLGVEELRAYLQGAYYKISAETLVMTSDFVGIGTATYPFHGVIVGNGTTVHMPDYTNIGTTGFGGFVSVANGCAVHGITIRYGTVGLSSTWSINGTATSKFSDKTAPVTGTPHFGGVIGWVVTGDNVIDGVTVTIDTLNKGHYASAFGAYVGLISGGGVSLRNLGEYTLPDAASLQYYYYYNAYVGKIIDGYAISNDRAYDNSTKNSSIPVISLESFAAGSQSGWVGSLYEFRLGNAEQLLMLYYAMNSGALAYNEATLAYGMGALSRFGSYASVGVEGAADVTNGRYKDDITGGSSGSNLFTDYFGCQKRDWKSTELSILLTAAEYDLSVYGNAFRGLGTAVDGNAVNCFPIQRVVGITNADGTPGTTVKLASEIRQYFSDDKYEKDALVNLAFVIERNNRNAPVTFKNIKLSGKIALIFTDGNGAEPEAQPSGKDFCVGGFMGYVRNAAFINVAIEDLYIKSPAWAGALVASSDFDDVLANTTYNSLVVDGCTVERLTIESKRSAGGLFGNIRMRSSKELIFRNISVADSLIRVRTSLAHWRIKDAYAGGLIGHVYNGSSSVHPIAMSGVTVRGSAVLLESQSYAKKNYAAGGLIGRISGTSRFEFDGCTVDGCVIGAYSPVNGSSGFPSDNADAVAGLTGSVYDRIANAVAYLLANPGSVSDGDAGGFIGTSEYAFTVRNSRVVSDAASTIILGFVNAGGILGIGRGAGNYVYSGLEVRVTGHSFYILGKSGAAGICPSLPATATITVTAENVTVAGKAGTPIRILAVLDDGNFNANASGLFASAPNNENTQQFTFTLTDIEVAYCVLSGSRAASIYCSKAPAVKATLGNIRAYKNYLQSKRNVVAGIMICAANDTVIDGLYVGDNIIRRADGDNTQIAGVIMHVPKSAVVQGYDVLLKDNDIGYSKAGNSFSMEALLASDGTAALYQSSFSSRNSGALVYKNYGVFNIFALSRKDALKFDGKDIIVETGTSSLLYVAYGAAEKYWARLGTENPLTQKEAIVSMTGSASLSDGSSLTLGGDPATRTDGMMTPDFLNDAANLPFWNASVLLDKTGMTTLSEFITGLRRNQTLPLLSVTGKTDETLKAYLRLITNGGFDGRGDAFTLSVDSVRYLVTDTGLLEAKNETGSIVYDAQKDRFTSGKFDNLTTDEKTLTILTVTFTSAADSSHTYVLNVVVYNPQILEIKSFISALEGEVYQISSFLNPPSYATDISSGSRFALYLEYAYNEVVSNLGDFNFDKRVYSDSLDGSATGRKDKFLSGTSFILIDLNSKTASGFRYYCYTLTEDGLYIDFSLFNGGDSGFVPKSLETVISNALGDREHLCTDPDFSVIERYLMIVIPSGKESGSLQYNLKAQVKENDRNIIVNSVEKICSVSVWGEVTGSFDFTADSSVFSNLAERTLTAKADISEIFPAGYVTAMLGRTFFGTHVFRIRDSANRYVSLPAGTVFTLTDDNGNILLTSRITTPTSSVRYTIDDILKKADSATGTYSDSFHVTFDFSAVPAKEFNAVFSSTDRQYTLQDDFYLSGDRDHYMSGTRLTGQKAFTTEFAAPVKVAVVPEERKHLAINFGGITDETDDGKIFFGVTADFSAVPDVTIRDAKIGFSIYQKKYDKTTGKHYYDETVSLCGTGQFGDVTNADLSAFGGTLAVTDGVASGRFLLTLDLDAARADLASYLSNYRLVVTITGYDENGNETAYSAEGYFVFLLCDIQNQAD